MGLSQWHSYRSKVAFTLPVALLLMFFQNCEFSGQLQTANSRSMSQNSPTRISSGNGEPYEGKPSLSIEKIFSLDSLPKLSELGQTPFVRKQGKVCSDSSSADFESLFHDSISWNYSGSQCSGSSSTEVESVYWDALMYELAVFEGKIFELQSQITTTRPVVHCASNDSLGKFILEISENDVFPELPKYRSAELNFYLKNIPQDVTYQRTDSISGIATYYDASGELKYAKSNEPRFDHEPITGRYLGLLIEGQMTNLIPFSEQMNQLNSLPWQTDRWVAPDSFQTADVLSVDDPESQLTFINLDTTYIKVSTGLSISFFMKMSKSTNEVQSFSFHWSQTDSSGTIKDTMKLQFDGSNIELEEENEFVKLTPLKNGWVRVSLSDKNYTKSNTILEFENRGFVGDLSIWGVQLEGMDFPSSYIKTMGSPEVRGDDIVDWTVGDWMNAQEGTFLFEWNLNGLRTNRDQHIFSGSSGNDITVEKSRHDLYNVFVSSNKALDDITIESGADYRSAVSYSPKALRGVHNGGLKEKSGVAELKPNSIYKIGRDDDQIGQHLYGHIKRVSYWNRELDKYQLVDMTSQQRHSSPYSGVVRTTGFDLTFPNDGLETTLLSVTKKQDEDQLQFYSSNYSFQLTIENDGTSLIRTNIQDTQIESEAFCTVDQ